MNAWLSGWLKEIVLVIMLATFVDLLLPGNAMQRYVKTVLGLFILLTLLSPLLALFRSNWDAGKLLASVEQLGSNPKAGVLSGSDRLRPLESIVRDGMEIRETNREEVRLSLEKRLAAELQQFVQTVAEVQVKRVHLNMKYDNDGTPHIEHMQVVLDDIDRDSPAAATGGNEPARKPIRPVEPVNIHVRVGEAPANTEEARTTPEQERVKEQLYEQLKRQWQLNRNQVSLLYEKELGK